MSYEERKQKILEYVNSKEYKLLTVKQIAVLFGVPKDEHKELEKIINKLEVEGKIYIDDSKRICSLNNASKFVCKYEAKSKGFGFARVISTNSNVSDIYISREMTNGAFEGDTVLVDIIRKGEFGKNLEGKVVKIIQRGEAKFVGIVRKNDSFGFVEVLNGTINDIYIPFKLMRGVENNDRVVVKITKYPTDTRKAEGKIIEIIGHESDKDVEQAVILASHGIVDKFPNPVIEEAEQVSNISNVDLEGRVDLRDKKIFTIDGDDAKDLDDAVCVEKLSDEEYKLSVHIADVSYYVKENTAIDKEAIKRGTSIYTPGRVIPMLPRALSNGICSLTEGETRLTLSVDMIINSKAQVTFSTIYKSVIKSKKQMTYDKVEQVLNGNAPKDYEPYVQDILLMQELALVLKNKREKDGSINFDIPETKFVLDSEGEPIELGPYRVGEANNIIEEFMLITNKVVAKTFKEIDAPFIYRIHEVPDLDKLRELNETLKNMGSSIKGINKIHPKAIATVLEDFKSQDKQYMIVSKLILRSLKLAKYAPICLGHFGLNFKDYCHFTSPIRRYPDLFIHRVISKYLETGYNLEQREYEKLKNKSEKLAITCSECEKIATEVERDFDDLFMAKYMARHLGEEYEGVISSITSFGMYVKLDNTVEGFVALYNLADDYYIYNEKEMSLIGERTSKKYEIGQKVRIIVERCSIESRQIDFTVLEE